MKSSSQLLPDAFQFSQSSLQDFADCPRRFLLRRIEKRAYPAPEAEPIRANELRRQRGIQFHQMICQDASGVPRDRIDEHCASDEILRGWWESYKECEPAGTGGECLAEITITGSVAGFPLTATYDLLAIRPDGTLHIFDWKTSRRRSQRSRLARRLQTKVYPYLLVQAGAWLNGGTAPQPEEVSMTYWFSNHPHDPSTFEYSAFQYGLDKEDLEGYVRSITSRGGRSEFELTDDEAHCRYCTYRPHCDRGVQAGSVREVDVELDVGEELEISLGEVEEISF